MINRLKYYVLQLGDPDPNPRYKPVDEFTGQESYIHTAIKRKDLSFFPLQKSLQLYELEVMPGEEDFQDESLSGAGVPQDILNCLNALQSSLSTHAEDSKKKVDDVSSHVTQLVHPLPAVARLMMPVSGV